MVRSDTAPSQAQEVDAIFRRFPDYKWNGQQESQLRGELYAMLLQLVGPEKMVSMANTLLKLERV